MSIGKNLNMLCLNRMDQIWKNACPMIYSIVKKQSVMIWVKFIMSWELKQQDSVSLTNLRKLFVLMVSTWTIDIYQF